MNVEQWADRHGIDLSATDAKAAFEDAASVCLEENKNLKDAMERIRQAYYEWDGGGAGSACRALFSIQRILQNQSLYRILT